MKQYWIFVIVLFTLYSFVNPEKLFEIEESIKRPNLLIEKDTIYIADGQRLFINSYSLSSHQLISSFGKKGEGPGELKSFDSMAIIDDQLMIRTMDKLIFFGLDGVFKNEIRTPARFRNITPIGDKYFAVKSGIDPKSRKRLASYYLFDMNLESPIEIYSGIGSSVGGGIHFSQVSNKKPIVIILPHSVIGLCNGNEIIIGDSTKGLHFNKFSSAGKIIQTINVGYKKQRIKRGSKDKYKNLKMTEGAKMIFPHHYPAFFYFRIYDGLIYVFTHNQDKDRRRETIILNQAGEKIKTLFMLHYPFRSYIYKGKLYSVIHGKADEWELHVEEIE